MKPRRADILMTLRSKTGCILLKPWYSIEILHSHAVSEEKTKELHSVGCGVLEVLASDVLEFKNTLEEDKPFYIRNRHSLCRIPWTCKGCMEFFANERLSRWMEYETWYEYQWIYQDMLVAETMTDNARFLKRKALQSQNFQSIDSLQLINVNSKYKSGHKNCLHCKKWVLPALSHTFYSSNPNIENEPWWHEKILTDPWLKERTKPVQEQHYCKNCVHKCSNCEILRPLTVLRKYGLCMRCNTNDDFFDKREKRRLNTKRSLSDSECESDSDVRPLPVRYSKPFRWRKPLRRKRKSSFSYVHDSYRNNPYWSSD